MKRVRALFKVIRGIILWAILLGMSGGACFGLWLLSVWFYDKGWWLPGAIARIVSMVLGLGLVLMALFAVFAILLMFKDAMSGRLDDA